MRNSPSPAVNSGQIQFGPPKFNPGPQQAPQAAKEAVEFAEFNNAVWHKKYFEALRATSDETVALDAANQAFKNAGGKFEWEKPLGSETRTTEALFKSPEGGPVCLHLSHTHGEAYC